MLSVTPLHFGLSHYPATLLADLTFALVAQLEVVENIQNECYFAYKACKRRILKKHRNTSVYIHASAGAERAAFLIIK